MRNRAILQFLFWGLILGGGGLRAQTLYSFSFESVPLQSALENVAKESGHRLFFSPSKVDLSARISYQCENQGLRTVLDALLRPHGIVYALKGGKLLLQPGTSAESLSVRVLEGGTGMPVAGAQLYIPRLKKGVVTDQLGRGEFRELATDSLVLHFRCIGYADTTRYLFLPRGQKQYLTLFVLPVPLELEDVVIQYDNLISAVGPSFARLNRKAVAANQSVNEDPLAVIRMVPGIASANSLYLNSGLHVRGGEPSENLTLLDNIQLPFPTFLNGRSAINPAFIEEVEVLTGGYSARYGNHLSSVQNFKTRSGDFRQYHGKIRQSMWNSQLELEGPLKKEKVSFLGIVRKATTDWLWKDIDELIPATLDADLKLEARLNARHELSFTNLYVRDRLIGAPQGRNEAFAAQANILSQSLQWQYFPHEKVYSKFGVLGGTTRWHFDEPPPFYAHSRQAQLEIREDLLWNYHTQHHLKIGAAWEREKVRGGVWEYYEAPDHGLSDSTLLLLEQNLDADVNRMNAYVTAEGNLTTWLRYQAGMRLDHHLTYRQSQVSPRFSLDVYPVPKWKLNVTAGWFSQDPAPHLPRQFPDLRPARAIHYIAGLHGNPWNRWTVSLEVYRKNYRELVILDRQQRYRNGGAGQAQGMELKAEWTAHSFRLATNYSWSYSQRQRHFQLAQYPYYFNQRHVANLWAIWEPGSAKTFIPSRLQADFRFASGRPFTPATGLLSPTGQFALQWGAINSARLPASHGLNLRLEWQRKILNDRPGELQWYLSLWNLYGYPNPIGVEFSQDPSRPGTSLATTLTSLPFFFDLGISFAF